MATLRTNNPKRSVTAKVRLENKRRIDDAKVRIVRGHGRVVGYVRVSTSGQEKGHSLPAQKRLISEHTEGLGYEVLRVYSDTESGAKAQRHGLSYAMDAVERGECEGIVFQKIDRLGRSMIDLVYIVEWAKAIGATLISVDEGAQVVRGECVDKMLPIRLAIAEIERQHIRERTRMGLAEAKRKGKMIGTPRRLDADSPVTRRMLELHAAGGTLRGIAKQLNDEGFRGPMGGEVTRNLVFYQLKRAAPQPLPDGGFKDERVGRGLISEK